MWAPKDKRALLSSDPQIVCAKPNGWTLGAIGQSSCPLCSFKSQRTGGWMRFLAHFEIFWWYILFVHFLFLHMTCYSEMWLKKVEINVNSRFVVVVVYIVKLMVVFFFLWVNVRVVELMFFSSNDRNSFWVQRIFFL